MTTAAPTRTSRTPQDEATPQFPAGIELVGSQMRSTNLERDVEDELHGPYVGAKAVDVLERIANAVGDLRRPRAWSFTGPYGSGKSTLANLIDALLGRDEDRRNEAHRILADTSSALAERLATARAERTGTGFLGAVATARREPLVATVTRALDTAAKRRWGKRIPKNVVAALAACEDPTTTGPKTKQVMAAIKALTDNQQPLLLIIDEFGKTLEHLAGHNEFSGAENDLFLLQELAEHSAGPNGLPVFLVTLQHLSFMDYASRSSELKIREWAKIQGRFEDVTFVPHHGDSLQLLRRRLNHAAVDAAGQDLIRASAQASALAWKNHGLNILTELASDDFANLYPLHPLTAIAAPILAAQIGQHDRSLSGFLNSGEPNTVRDSLAEHSRPDAERASTVQLPQLYDYFLNSGRTSLLAASNAGRWIEVDARIKEANGLPDADQALLKTIGVLNLIDADGALSATSEMIHLALHDPTDLTDAGAFAGLEEQLADLVRRGFLVHREFSGEYRVWQGTDFDIDARLKEIISHLDDASIVQRLGAHLPSAVVAGRHSQVTGMMRVFLTAVSGPETREIHAPDELKDPADGLLVFHLGPRDQLPTVNSTLPVVLGTTTHPDVVLNSATHLIALKELLEDKELDHVARREVTDRAVQAEAELREVIQTAFYPPTQEATWDLWNAGLAPEASPGSSGLPARSLSGLVSLACGSVFPQTPHIRNEMLGRHSLTSNAARARSDVLDAMLTRSGEQYLGFDATAGRYGPERAIYSGALAYLGLHRANGTIQAENSPNSLLPYGFSAPGEGHEHAQPVWEALQEALDAATRRTSLDHIIRVLMSPPYGVKAGVWPLLVVTALVIRRHDVALFEEGSYLPRLTPDVVDRILAAPARFDVKYTPVGQGQRASVIKKLLVSLKVEPPRSQALRNPDLLSVARASLERVMVLNSYARKTKRISPDALAVRNALANSQDPDDLLFRALPKALGLAPIEAGTRANAAAATEYADRLTAAADEITGIERTLREEVVEVLAEEFRLPTTLPELRSTLAARLSGFATVSLNPELRGFVDFVLSESLADEDWLDPIVVRLTNKALGDWDDRDAGMFPRLAREMSASLDRVAHLYQDSSETREQEVNLETRLLTLTDKTGAERRTLIYVPEQSRGQADQLAADVLQQAEQALGPDGARILLAALAQRVADGPSVTATETKEGA
ncbi:KAP family NTPase [Streptomyces sp. 8L]|uniref:KAP family NTPase n=1 Tax=Streptomyces sp. 8L TaxID=2877242 RepID=UPI001CD55C7F|nr:KAP family NTPase [Streptomyces sp. 8L]MCA1220006.1 KAP family NTPase [Streptomyces sp. 8L]